MNEIETLYNKAREARIKGDNATSLEYYKEIYKADPKSHEAIFYITYFEAMEAKLKDFWSMSISVMNIERETFTAIKKEISADKQSIAVESVCNGLNEISRKITHDTKKHFANADQTVRDEFISEYVSTLSVAAEILYSYADDMTDTFGDKYSSLAVTAWKEAINTNLSYVGFVINKDEHRKTIEKYSNKILKYDKSYKAPDLDFAASPGSGFKSKIKRLFCIFK